MSIFMWPPKCISRKVKGSERMWMDTCIVHMILVYLSLKLQLSVFTMGFKFTVEYQEIVSNLCCVSFLNPSRLRQQGSKCDVPFQSLRTCDPIQMQRDDMYSAVIQTMTSFISCLCPLDTNHEAPLHPEYSRALKADEQQCRTTLFHFWQRKTDFKTLCTRAQFPTVNQDRTNLGKTFVAKNL